MPDVRMIAVIVTSLVLGGTLAGAGVAGAHEMGLSLTAQADRALVEAGIDNVDVRFSGREATLSGGQASAAELAEARHVVAALPGVRWVTVQSGPSSDPEFTFLALGRADLLFTPDSVQLTAQASRQLILVAGVLADHSTWRVHIVGHVAVIVGGPEQATTISTERAQVVADELVRLGVDARRLSVAGVGADDPVSDNSTLAGAANNRRVTLELKKGP